MRYQFDEIISFNLYLIFYLGVIYEVICAYLKDRSIYYSTILALVNKVYNTYIYTLDALRIYDCTIILYLSCSFIFFRFKKPIHVSFVYNVFFSILSTPAVLLHGLIKLYSHESSLNELLIVIAND